MENDSSSRNLISRRSFSTLALASAAAAATGCSFTRPEPICKDESKGRPINIDMHCHLMNIWDVDPAAFANRRFFNTDEIGPIADLFSGLFVRLHTWPAYVTTNRPETEWRRLRDDLAEVMPSYQEFCEYADEEQGGILFSGAEKRITGFLSDRARNAALMMMWFPKIDIFTPSMVDLYEGWFDNAADMFNRAKFYETLNLATYGRFLPLVSFHPKRQMAEQAERDPDYPTPLELVEECITKKGFVGVKVHPSSGFSPYENEKYGCPNTILQLQDRLTREEADDYDKNMKALYRLCKKLDVPILTHNGTGIASHAWCMFRKYEKNWREKAVNWTNSPEHWFQAMEQADKDDPGLPKLRVCLAHLAGGFLKKDDAKVPHPWLKIAAEKVEKSDQLYVDLSELSEMIRADYDPGKDETRIKDGYKTAFDNFFKDGKLLGKRLMYGTDLHMPGASLKGKKYLPAIKHLIDPYVDTEMTMGGNAVEFFGLKPGRQNRLRLEAFYDKHDIDLREIPWMRTI